jgi:hypothetical protein
MYLIFGLTEGSTAIGNIHFHYYNLCKYKYYLLKIFFNMNKIFLKDQKDILYNLYFLIIYNDFSIKKNSFSQ